MNFIDWWGASKTAKRESSARIEAKTELVYGRKGFEQPSRDQYSS